MSHPIPPGISDITVYLMATSFVWIGASVDKLPEVEDLDGAEIGSREATWLGCLWMITGRRVCTSRLDFTTKPVSLTGSFFYNLFCDWFSSSYPLC